MILCPFCLPDIECLLISKQTKVGDYYLYCPDCGACGPQVDTLDLAILAFKDIKKVIEIPYNKVEGV